MDFRTMLQEKVSRSSVFFAGMAVAIVVLMITFVPTVSEETMVMGFRVLHLQIAAFVIVLVTSAPMIAHDLRARYCQTRSHFLNRGERWFWEWLPIRCQGGCHD